MTGHDAVARKFCQVLACRCPGTTWLPADPTKGELQGRVGEVVVRLGGFWPSPTSTRTASG